MSSILKWFWRPSACYARRVAANRVSPDSPSRIDSGRIRFLFNSAPPRRYDAAGGGGDSIELNWGTRFVGCEKKKNNPERRTCVAGIIK
jgi:hypothetical protein